MSSLPTPLRKQLAAAIERARTAAERGARNALQALAVHQADPYRHMNEAQRELRRKLRAQARQLGDTEGKTQRGTSDIAHLVEKLAYDQWHRLLFARYLLENNILISPAHGVSVSLEDCEELAPSESLKDAWAVAARYAAKELPEIFRADDPAGAVDLPLEDRSALVTLVIGLPAEVFTASDSLGWCYQFWQAEKKDAVNASGTKIGADELPAVTQLFTEDYMVDFLLDNTLGAWHAGRVLAANPHLAKSAQSEDEVRQAVALPGCEWGNLRFLQGEGGHWTPAAGTFDGWPKSAAAIKALDPCMGSGHFVVAMFERLVALRVAEEALDETAAVVAVIRDNLFGLEIDPRCTQIAAFNLALAAWRCVGYCQLPAMNLACSGLAPNAREADWLMIAGGDAKLRNGMARLYQLFKDAPVLGSLISPGSAKGNLLEASFSELRPLLGRTLQKETADESQEMAVAARGIAAAADILGGTYTLVATNYPFLLAGKQEATLKAHTEKSYPHGKNDLATCFLLRSHEFLADGGSQTVVMPHAWLFMSPTYVELRKTLIARAEWNVLAWLGPRAFETISGEVVQVALLTVSRRPVSSGHRFLGIDARTEKDASAKSVAIKAATGLRVDQLGQLQNPEHRVVLGEAIGSKVLGQHASSYIGLQTGDNPRFLQGVWEGPVDGEVWKFFQSPVKERVHFGGRQSRLRWEGGKGDLSVIGQIKGTAAWNANGVAVRLMSDLPPTLYDGAVFEQSSAVIIPKRTETLAALWCFCVSPEFRKQVQRIDKAIKITNKTFEKIAFDLMHWQRVAEEKYPQGLPTPFSCDPTQWLFNGHPVGADQPLQVAVARLLGYQWPRQTGSSFPGCPALGPDGVEALADDDGIVPISPIKGEAAGAERLRGLLTRAYGKEWSPSRQGELLTQVGYASSSLEDWLRNGFFEQHCALFDNRPFIWHIWDGRKDGFSALVNYHKLTHAKLETLTFAYLGDWIRRQQAAVDAGEAGSDARLEAAKVLQARLKLILAGEPPFDLFVRWKPVSQQAIGWHPDLNDGVRMNIRPFLAQDIPGGKKGAGILRAKPNIKWEKDRGNEPVRDKKQFPWFWGWDGQATDFDGVGTQPDGKRWNACHYTNAFKQRARDAEAKK